MHQSSVKSLPADCLAAVHIACDDVALLHIEDAGCSFFLERWLALATFLAQSLPARGRENC